MTQGFGGFFLLLGAGWGCGCGASCVVGAGSGFRCVFFSQQNYPKLL